MKLTCRFGWHNWAEWLEDIAMTVTTARGTRPAMRLKRKCLHCGLLKYRLVET
jgi:hypothetical protein